MSAAKVLECHPHSIWQIGHSRNLYYPGEKAAAAAKSLQSCPTLCDPIDGSPPGSPVPWILHINSSKSFNFPE